MEWLVTSGPKGSFGPTGPAVIELVNVHDAAINIPQFVGERNFSVWKYDTCGELSVSNASRQQYGVAVVTPNWVTAR